MVDKQTLERNYEAVISAIKQVGLGYLETFSRWPYPETNIPSVIRISEKKEKPCFLERLLGQIYEPLLYRPVVEITTPIVSVHTIDAKHESLARKLERRLAPFSLKPF